MERQPKSPEGSEAENPLTTMREVLTAAEEIGEKTGNETAMNVLAFVRENARVITMSPTKLGTWQAAEAPYGALSKDFASQEKHILNVYVYNPKDRPHLPANFIETMHIDDPLASATYDHTNKFLRWSSRPGRSPQTEGLTFLHEGFHAWWQQTQADVPPNQFWNHERDAHVFTYELATSIGGEAYQKAMRDHVDTIREQAEQSGNQIGSQYLKYFNWYARALDEAFGPTNDTGEQGARMQLLHTQSLFTAINEDSASSKEAMQRQSNLISRIYKGI